MMPLIGCCLFGFALISIGFWMLKVKKSGALIEFIAGGLFLLGGIIAIYFSMLQKTPDVKTVKTQVPIQVPGEMQQAGSFTYSDFKKNFQLGALQCGEPFSLADSLIQEGTNTSTMHVFFTDNSDMMLTMTASDHVIRDVTVYISGVVTDGVFDDLGYALAVIWALEKMSSPQDCATFIGNVLSLPNDEALMSKSGFRYSHPELTGKSVSFIAVNTN